jgi:hypothetical protein
MFIAYVTVTLLAAVFTGGCAYTYLSGHDYPKAMMTMKRIPHSWGPMLGALLAAGALGSSSTSSSRCSPTCGWGPANSAAGPSSSSP